jgi:PIN domain nuclease of toxin-antitoxin system
VYPFSAEEVAEAATKTGFIELPLHSDAVTKVSSLPEYHDDPFDRILLAQALIAPARFLTADRALSKYSDVVEVI